MELEPIGRFMDCPLCKESGMGAAYCKPGIADCAVCEGWGFVLEKL
jgi:hypothetical protein